MFKTLQTFDTELSADSVEWCPHENFTDLLVCGTYELKVEDEGSTSDVKRHRIGRIYLMKLNEQRCGLDVLQTIEVSAVLDMKWSRTSSTNSMSQRVMLGVASADGCLRIYELQQTESRLELISQARLGGETENNDKEQEDERLALSLDWAADQTRLTLSDSKGCVSCWQFQANTGSLERLVEWPAHDFEAWIATFDLRNSEVVYTGGDDLKLRSFDLRAGPVVINSRSHGAGVTSLQFHPTKEYSFVSGSYDEHLRHWDTRQLKRPLHELPLGGGLWRLKYEPNSSQPHYLLVAGMYGGFFLVDVATDPEQPKVVDNFLEHKSIAYGCDWSYRERDGDPPLVATCSFYDHCLKLSSINTEEC